MVSETRVHDHHGGNMAAGKHAFGTLAESLHLEKQPQDGKN